MNNKTIIEFGFRIIWTSEGVKVSRRVFGTRKGPIAIALKIMNIHRKLQLLQTQKISVLCQSSTNANNNNTSNNNNVISL